ncbi:MAG: LCP family protein [Candidatus Actinomarina sp.]
MNNSNRNIVLGTVLVMVAVSVFIFLVPNFEREEFDRDKIEDISQGITTTSEVQQENNNDEINDNNSQNQIEELIISENEKSEIEKLLINNEGDLNLDISAYLIIGSDERSLNSSAARGYVQGSRADVILLGIINEDSKNNHLISIPRDLLIFNSCTSEIERINASYQKNECGNRPENLAAAILNLTGIRVENFASFNFEGFEKIIDSFGGIEICVEKTQKEGYSFELQKGCQTVSGSTSLNWVVSRNTEVLVGEKIIDENGEDASVWEKMPGVSDLTRIERQQYVVLQMLKELDNFKNINEFTNFIEAIEETFIIDENLSIRKAIDLLWNLRDLDLDRIQKHTLPTYPYELEDGRQVLIMKESFKEFALNKRILDF